MRIVRRPRFRVDLVEAYAWIAKDNQRAAERLLDGVEKAVARLGDMPLLGAPREGLGQGIRSLRVRPFRHLLFYRVDGDEIVLVRLLHGARDLPAQDF